MNLIKFLTGFIFICKWDNVIVIEGAYQITLRAVKNRLVAGFLGRGYTKGLGCTQHVSK